MVASSLALIAGKVSTMGLGFVFWLVAARFFAPSEVGLAAGAISAVMLCTQLALLGLGSAVIVHFPRHRQEPSSLLDTAFTVVAISAAAAACLFLLLASVAFHELSVVASEPMFAAAFVCMSVLGTLGILLDQVSTALRRGDQVLVRAILFGVATVGALSGLALWFDVGSSRVIFSTWVAGALAASVLGVVQLWRTLARYRYRPHLRLGTARRLLAVGLPNHALTLTERTPGLVLPILVTELVSAEANAAWYAAWMMAWVLYIVPIQIGMTLFAEAARRTASLLDLVRHGLRLSLLLGGVGAAVLALAAHHILAILGQNYAAVGTTPLRILVIAVLPLSFVQVYFVTCRATARLGEATLTGAASGTTSVTVAAVAGIHYGLPGMALAWLGAQLLTGIWASWRLQAIARGSVRRVHPAADEGADLMLSMRRERPAAT
ncbi:MAG: oligosaccharide flippase family protein [Acidobacteria bacterium]|nr:oligosaccharide flippase family protein [Acidobacteriota bacterium]